MSAVQLDCYVKLLCATKHASFAERVDVLCMFLGTSLYVVTFLKG